MAVMMITEFKGFAEYYKRFVLRLFSFPRIVNASFNSD